MSASSWFTSAAKALGLIMLWILTALAAIPSKAALPPDAHVLVSGGTVRLGYLPEQIQLPDGEIEKATVEASFLATAIDDDTLYVWTSATQDVSPLTRGLDRLSALPPALIAMQTPDTAILEWGLMESAFEGIVQVERPSGGSVSLEELLSETGSFVVLNPQILQPAQAVPEPTFAVLIMTGSTVLGIYRSLRLVSSRLERSTSVL
ncbi:MAG: hypothetical protein AB8G23_02015 [Myxococcota bacterium]